MEDEMSKVEKPNVAPLLLAIVLITALIAWVFMVSLGGAGVSVGFLPVWGMVVGTRLLIGSSEIG